MSLHDEIEKIDKELETIAKTEGKEPLEKHAKVEKPEEKSSEADSDMVDNGDRRVEKPRKEAEKTGDKKEKIKTETASDEKDNAPEEKPDSAAFLAMRRDKAAAEKRAKLAEDQLRAREAAALQPRREEAPKAPAPANSEPDPNLDPEAHLRWSLSKTQSELKEIKERNAKSDKIERDKQVRAGAIKAYQDYEKEFIPQTKDYTEVTKFGVAQITNSIRIMNPKLEGEELQEAVLRQCLRLAAQAEAEGHNPAEHLYHMVKNQWGYQPPAPEPEAKPEEEKLRPSIKSIAANKKKTAGSLAHGGKSGNNPISKEAFANMGFAEVARLSAKDLRELEALEA